jgi:catechol 2,3-dioxygenase-like lactoylglutathione lyase family enzyme
VDVRIRQTFLPYTDPEAALRFYRDGLGLQLIDDVGTGTMRWMTLRSAQEPGICLILEPTATELSITPDERRAISSLLAKGCLTHITFVAQNLDEVFDALLTQDAEPLQEPIVREFGGRDCIFLDPSGTIVRIEEESGSGPSPAHRVTDR